MSVLVLPSDHGYVATCGECPWTREYPGELVAERRLAQHEAAHRRWADVLDYIRGINAHPRPLPVHIHTYRCTDSSCPGQGFPTRAELVAASRKRRGL